MAMFDDRIGALIGIEAVVTPGNISSMALDGEVQGPDDGTVSGVLSVSVVLTSDTGFISGNAWGLGTVVAPKDPLDPLVIDIGLLDQSPTGSIIFPFEFDNGSGSSSPTEVVGNSFYQYQQFIASAEWLIHHGLNRYPNVSVLDSSDEMVWADVYYVDLNNVRIEFSSATGGSAYLS